MAMSYVYFDISTQKRLAHAKSGLFPFGLVKVRKVNKIFRDLLYITKSYIELGCTLETAFHPSFPITSFIPN